MPLELTDADREALTTDYASGEVSRDDAAEYPLVQRGSARLVNELYRTENEQREYIDKGLKLRVPGQHGYRDTRAGLLGLFRALLRLR